MVNVVLIHGGAGSDTSFSTVLANYAKLSASQRGAMNVAVNAVRMLEDNPDFNAGTGSVKRIDGSIQMDAAVMAEEGFGSVVSIERVRNPVLVARAVMEKTPHLILSGDGATKFARQLGYEDYDPSTEKSSKNWEKMIKILSGEDNEAPNRYENYMKYAKVFGIVKDTVGAVSRVDGKFAAAVSTGGATPMMRGRVGDSPLPGCGIYSGKKGAVVATGIGEEIIKKMLCHNVYLRIGSEPLRNILEDEVSKFGVTSVGIIAVSKDEEAYSSNTSMATGIMKF